MPATEIAIMWEEDDSDRAEPESPSAQEEMPSGEHFAAFAGAPLLPAASMPHVVPMANLYEAARTRALADQQLSKLFNPEYYI
jgi:hypothetical protein